MANHQLVHIKTKLPVDWVPPPMDPCGGRGFRSIPSSDSTSVAPAVSYKAAHHMRRDIAMECTNRASRFFIAGYARAWGAGNQAESPPRNRVRSVEGEWKNFTNLKGSQRSFKLGRGSERSIGVSIQIKEMVRIGGAANSSSKSF